MKKGFALITLALVFGGLIVIGSGYLTARFLFNKNSSQSRDVSDEGSIRDDSSKKPEKTGGQSNGNLPSSQDKDSATAAESESLLAPTVYTQPQNLYTINLPKGWVVNSTTTVNNYSTTKFTGNEGNISITSGSGKDPIGGCSEVSSIILADRTISGCFLLQKDGSKFLTRGYTKSKGGLEITIEAYMNSPNVKSSPTILEAIKTIDID